MPRRPDTRADLRAVVDDARVRVARATGEARTAEEVLLARAEAALAAFDEAHPAPAPPMDGAQPESEARARWLAFLARQTTTTEETGR